MANFNDLFTETKELTQRFNESRDKKARKKLQDKIKTNFDKLSKLATQAESKSQKQLQRAIDGLQNQFDKFNAKSSELDQVQNIFFRSTDNISRANDAEVDRLMASVDSENKRENQRKAADDAFILAMRERLDALNDSPPSTTINTSNTTSSDKDINQYLTNSFQEPLNLFTEGFNDLLALDEDQIDEQLEEINLKNSRKTKEEDEAEIKEELATLMSSEKTDTPTTKISVATPKIPSSEKKEPTIAKEESPALLAQAKEIAEKTLEVKNDNIRKLEDLGSGNAIRKDPVRKAKAEKLNKKILSASNLFEELHALIINPIEIFNKALNILKSLFGNSNKNEQTKNEQTMQPTQSNTIKSEPAKNEQTPQPTRSNTIDIEAQKNALKKMEATLDKYKKQVKEKIKTHKKNQTDHKKDPSVKRLLKMIVLNKTSIKNMKGIIGQSIKAEKILSQQSEVLSTRRLSR